MSLLQIQRVIAFLQLYGWALAQWPGVQDSLQMQRGFFIWQGR